MALRFQDLESFTAADVEAALQRNDPSELALVPITAALLARDVALAMDVCCRLARDPAPPVRGSAVVSLGHLARRFGMLDEHRVRPLLEEALRDPDEGVRSLAKSAADEVHQFLHWTIAGHTYG
jgi:HEAT repeat protein